MPKRTLTVLPLYLLLVCVLMALSQPAAAAMSIGLLADDTPASKLGREARAVRDLATAKYSAKVVQVVADGKFVDSAGKAITLSSFNVLWYHQGDSISLAGPIHGAKTREALRSYVKSGKGLYLSGAALAMVRTLGVDNLKLRFGGPGNNKTSFGFVPVVARHPIFSGLKARKGMIMLSDAGFPAYSDFHGSGGPKKGMILGRTGGGVENPIVEFKHGKGRIIVLGWALPNYSNSTNRHRRNLEQLTVNILGYLGNPKRYQKFIISSAPTVARSKAKPGSGTPVVIETDQLSTPPSFVEGCPKVPLLTKKPIETGAPVSVRSSTPPSKGVKSASVRPVALKAAKPRPSRTWPSPWEKKSPPCSSNTPYPIAPAGFPGIEIPSNDMASDLNGPSTPGSKPPPWNR